MQVKKIYENIYCLTGSRSSNIYYFDFEKKAILDTGHPAEIEKNVKIFKDAGFLLENVDYIINTHSHPDHVGANAYLKRQNPAIKIVGSSNKEKYQSKRREISYFPEVEDPFEDYKIDIEMENQKEIDLGGMILKCFETKGHSSDSLSFYCEKSGYLFSGDTIYFQIITQLDYYQNIMISFNELTKTYEWIKDLNPVKIFTGHGVEINKTLENVLYCLKKLKRLERDPEMLLINNLVPMVEIFIYKNDGITKNSLIEIFLENMYSKCDEEFLSFFDTERFPKIFEKIIALMKLLNMIDISGEKLSLCHNLNNYIG